MKTKHRIFIFLAAITIFRLFFINTFPLLGDEAYYWQWARHLDLGYYEQGPMVALVIFICTCFTKISTLFTIRLGAVLLSLATMIAAYFTFKNFSPDDSEDRDNFLNILLINSSLIYSLGAVLMMHDTVMVFFYSVFLYCLTHIIKEPDNNPHWAHAGIILGLGIMSKLTMGVVYIGLLAFLVFTGSFRKYLKGFIIFTLFTLLFTTPYICWNFTHDLATVKYLFIRGGSGGGFTLRYFGELIGSQILLIAPFLIALFAAAFIKNVKKPEFNLPYAFATLFWVTLLPFLLLSLKSRVEANWPVFTFLPLFFLGTSYISGMKADKKKGISTVILAGGFAMVIAAHALAAFSYILPEKPNPLRKSYGYKELAEKTYNVYNEYTAKKPGFFATRYYQTASLLSFYTPGQPEYYVLIQHESNKNYRFWKGYDSLKGQSCVFVYNEPWESAENAVFFDKLVKTEKIEVKYGNYGTKSFNIDFLEGLK
jgi:4-amino-4-deoxy-L-arabinose transferase-like glycosyltransferase